MGDILLGCIADDFTGATDLANNLVRGGMRTVQTIGVPQGRLSIDADAVVVALKARQIYFKYCSTFDSTPAGNIGPVTEALMQAIGCDFTIACPAFPENGRAVF